MGQAVVAEPSAPPAGRGARPRSEVGAAPDLPRRRARRRQDLRDVFGGASSAERGTRRRRRRASRRMAGHARSRCSQGLETVPTRTIPYRGTVFEEMDADAVRMSASPRSRSSTSSRTRTSPAPARQALGGRDRPARRRDRGDHDRQHPASREPERRGRRRDRGQAARDGSRLGGRAGRPDRARRHVAARAATSDAARQRLPRPAKAELALQRYFTTDNLTALRELALMRVANQVDETLLSRWSRGARPRRANGSWSASRAGLRRRPRPARRADRPAGPRRPPRGPRARAHERETTAWLSSSGSWWPTSAEAPCDRRRGPREGVLNFAYTQFVTQLVVGESPIAMRRCSGIVRQRAVPEGRERSTSTLSRARALRDARAGPCTSDGSRVGRREQDPVVGVDRLEPLVDRADEDRVEHDPRSRASSRASIRPPSLAGVTGHPTVITTSVIDPATSPGYSRGRLRRRGVP